MSAHGKPPEPQQPGQGGRARIIARVAGYGFLLLGIAGLFLPMLQGVLFIFIGLMLLAPSSRWALRFLAYIRYRFPQTAAQLLEARARARRWLKRFLGKSEGRS